MSGFRSFAFLVSLSLFAGSSARAQTVLFSDDFENGTAKWTTDAGFWHLTTEGPPCHDAPFPSGSHCMWFGVESQCTYANSPWALGTLRLAEPVALPAGGGGVFLDFWSRTQTEEKLSWDTRKVWVSTNGPSNWTLLYTFGVDLEPWTLHTIDLSDYAGHAVYLIFTFWVGDDEANDYLGWLIDDVQVRTGFEIYRRSCYGDGSATACPCGNSSAVGAKAGCLNSLGTGGRLCGSGFASLAHDTLVLSGADMPNTTVFYYQGASQLNGGTGIVLGDGLSCVGGPIRRLGTTTNSAGASACPVPGGSSISVAGQISSPGARWYQARYRNGVNFCTPDTFNSTNMVKVNWMP